MSAEAITSPGSAEPAAAQRFADGEDEAYRILLVEDDSGDALLVRELLADTGLKHTLHWTQTLAGALDELRRQTVDCVLLDLHLPDASGIPFVRSVQDAGPAAAVIVLTGVAESHSGAAAVANGAQDYLVKGQVDADLLHRALRYAVHRKQAERAAAELNENRVRAGENARLERGLLPAPLLLGDGAFVVTTRYLPSRDQALLGGDFLDLVQTPDGTVHAVIGDVSGHGPDEAALGVSLRIAWRALVLAGHQGSELIALLDQVLVAERPDEEMFATCSTLTLDLKSGSATVFLAGHHEPLLTGPEGTGPVVTRHGTALGIGSGRRTWHPTTFDLPDTGALMLYTDGLIEGHDGPGSARLGTSGLLALIAAAPVSGIDPFLDHLVATARRLDAGRHADDLAILHLAWGAAGA